MNLSNLNLAELRDLEEQVRREIKKRQAEGLARAREEIQAIAERLGVPLKDILGAQGKIKATRAAVLQHPTDSNLTWSGRGRQPGWIKEWIASGQAIEALRT